MDKPDVSVILTSYNTAAYIGAALDSALSQEGVTLEVIVADDASRDDSWTVLSRVTDPRVTALRLEENGGPSVARNAAIAAASGRWLAVLDGDDRFLPGRLARCLARAESHGADIVVDNLLVHREEDGGEYLMFPPARLERMRMLDLAAFIRANRLFAGGYALGYAKPVFSAAFLRRHRLSYDPALRIGEDYQLMAEALACGARCAVEPQAGYRYTMRRGSISHRLRREDIERMREGDARLLARFPLSPAAAKAQAEREASLARAHAFTRLIDALKARDAAAALKAAAACPACVLLLRLPLAARLRRLRQRVWP